MPLPSVVEASDSSPTSTSSTSDIDMTSLAHEKTRLDSSSSSNRESLLREPDLFFSSLKITDKSTLYSLVPSSAAGVRSIDLSINLLTEIDLSPLAHCKQLTCLMLNDNNLASLDLTPLKDLKNLQKIWLQNNQLTTIDLSPLKTMDSLKCLYLHNNKIDNDSIDLSPLTKLKSFSALTLKGNKLNKKLDVTFIVASPNLTMFSVDDDVQLTAQYTFVVPEIEDFSQSLQKFYSRTIWEKVIKNQAGIDQTMEHSPILLGSNSSQLTREKEEPLYKVLVLGFSLTCAQQIRDALFGVEGCSWQIHAIDYGQPALDFVSCPRNIERFNIFLIYPIPEAPNYVTKIRNACMSSVIFVINDTTKVSEESTTATKLCIRFGASCVATIPLCSRSVNLIKDRAQKVSRKIDEEALVRSIEAPSSQKANKALPAHKMSPVCQFILPNNQIDFRSLKTRFSYGRNLLQSRLKLEESALKAVFAKHGNRVSESEMSNIATLLGIPISSAIPLFISVLHYLENADFGDVDSLSGRDSPASIILSISFDEFMDYYEQNLKNRGVDARLHYVLASSAQHNKSRHLVGKNSIQLLMDMFIRRKNGILSAVKTTLSGEDVAKACADIIIHGLGAKTTVFSSSDFHKVNFCNKMLAAESAIYDGIFAPLRPDRFQNILKEFSRALGVDMVPRENSRLSQEQMLIYCRANKLLTPGAVHVLFMRNVTKEQGGMNLGDFAKFLLSISDPTHESSANYFFSILDTNMDGRVCTADLGFHYFEKQTELRNEGYNIVSFVHVTRLTRDMISTMPPRDHSRTTDRHVDSFTRKQFLQTSKEGRGILVKCMLFLNDDMALVDIRSSCKKQTPDEALAGKF